jgi:N-acetylglutamate synthase-like GNAT family acetyltransferase
MNGIAIRDAGAKDAAGIRGQLQTAGLPVPAPGDAPVTFRVAVRDGRVVAVAGWEIHDGEALLRSVAVDPAERGTGTGTRLVQACLDALGRQGVAGITLVTLEAQAFFARLGFRPIARGDVPLPIRGTGEYAFHGCSAGTWMRREGG